MASSTSARPRVLRFLGRTVPAHGHVHRRYQGEMETDLKHRPAGEAVVHCVWGKAFHCQLRRAGKRHQATLRALAFKWTRILWRFWYTCTPYDDRRYTDAFRRRDRIGDEYADDKGWPRRGEFAGAARRGCRGQFPWERGRPRPLC